jgi:hypothetical protein
VQNESTIGSIFRQISILKPEIALLPLTPGALPVEVYIHALLILFRDRLRLRVTLEPCEVLDMEPPRLPLQLLRGEVSASKET